MVNILRVRCPVDIALGIQRALVHLLNIRRLHLFFILWDEDAMFIYMYVMCNILYAVDVFSKRIYY